MRISTKWIVGAVLAGLGAGCAEELAGDDGPCAGVVCVDALPASVAVSFASAPPSRFDAYGCSPEVDLSGPEVVHRVTLPADGFLAVSRSGSPDDGSVVRLLRTLDPLDCTDAHSTRVGARLPAGEAFVVVDSPSGGNVADVTLRIALITTSTFESVGVAPELATDALTTFSNAWAWGSTRRLEYAVTDFTLHSAEPREWVFDLGSATLLFHLRVAHGRNSSDPSDLAHAATFSNEPGSNQSSLGVYRSAGSYVGTFGPSFRLEGLEPGVNDNVCRRDIVMHPWAPMGDEYVTRCGRARPSLGCPAIDSLLSMPVRDLLARPEGATLDEGVLMLFWYGNTSWQASSPFLHATAPSAELTAQAAQRCDSSQTGSPDPPASSDYLCD